MAPQSTSIPDVIRANQRAFVISIIVGATLAVGVRSMFVDGDAPMDMSGASASAKHTEGRGGHTPGMAMDDPNAAPELPQSQPESTDDKRGDNTAENAAGNAELPASDAPTGVLLDLGNTLCPIMGGEVDGKTFSEWNGLRVSHCCGSCIAELLEAPDAEAKIEEVAPQWRAAANAAKAIDAATGAEQQQLLAEAAKKWAVVRKPTAPTTQGLLIDVGNAECPVMGGEPDGKTFSEWNGLRVNHCCPMCGKKFLANPEALLDEVAPNWRDAAAAVRAVNDAEGAEREAKLNALREKWTVVREPAAPK